MDLEELKANMQVLMAKTETLSIQLLDKEKENSQSMLPRFPIETRENFDDFEQKLDKEKVVRLQLVRSF